MGKISFDNRIFRSGKRTSMLRRVVSTALILAVLSFSPANAQQKNNPPEARTTAGLSEFLDAAVGEADTFRKETDLQRTLRLVMAPGWHPELMELRGLAMERVGNSEPGASLARIPTSFAQNSSQTVQSSSQNRKSPWMPWWAWALVGAGIATAGLQLEFGDDADENELD